MTIYVGELATLLAGGGSAGPVYAADIQDASVVGKSVLTAASQASARTAIGAGTAATSNTGDFATAAQGAKADAAQPKIGAPSVFTSRNLTDEDDGKTLICSTAQVANVPAGLTTFNGALFDGPVSFPDTSRVTDSRTPGAPIVACYIYRIGVDAYRVVGGKA